jgi:precorrin-6Y C5,15-methyltransferase (decarboxylating)
MRKWLSIVGIGEDGLSGLGELAQSLIAQAEVLVGGVRHLAMLPADDPREKLLWTTPLETTIEQIIRRRGQSVCILASGDPMCHGIGVTLTKRLPLEEMIIVPTVSAFCPCLCASRLVTCRIETFSLTNRPTAVIASALYQGARLLVLSADKHSPEKVATLLKERGFGKSQIRVERMGGLQERRIEGVAATWDATEVADLNTIAIACVATQAIAIVLNPPLQSHPRLQPHPQCDALAILPSAPHVI